NGELRPEPVTFAPALANVMIEGGAVTTAEDDLKPLMVRALSGDAAAYAALLKRLTAHLRAYYLRRLGSGRAADAEDLLQETLIAMHAKRHTYDPSRPFTAWVHAIARYKLIDFFRAKGRRPELQLDDAADDVFASEDANATEARLDVERLLKRLPEKTRAVLRDVKLSGLSTAEAAERHGLSESAVKVGIHRGIKKLSAGLEDESA